MATPQEHFNASRKFQEYYDEVLREIGARAPEPVLGQSVNDYRRETLRTIKRTYLPQNHDLYQVQFRRLKADALDVWPAPGSEDTELGVLMELEMGHGETEVYARVQA
jgi:hypothetical protein